MNKGDLLDDFREGLVDGLSSGKSHHIKPEEIIETIIMLIEILQEDDNE